MHQHCLPLSPLGPWGIVIIICLSIHTFNQHIISSMHRWTKVICYIIMPMVWPKCILKESDLDHSFLVKMGKIVKNILKCVLRFLVLWVTLPWQWSCIQLMVFFNVEMRNSDIKKPWCKWHIAGLRYEAHISMPYLYK